MIMFLKIPGANKIFGRIFLRAISDTFFPICGLGSGKWQGAWRKGEGFLGGNWEN